MREFAVLGSFLLLHCPRELLQHCLLVSLLLCFQVHLSSVAVPARVPVSYFKSLLLGHYAAEATCYLVCLAILANVTAEVLKSYSDPSWSPLLADISSNLPQPLLVCAPRLVALTSLSKCRRGLRDGQVDSTERPSPYS